MWPFPKKQNEIGSLRRRFHHILIEQRKKEAIPGLFRKNVPSNLRLRKRQKPGWVIALQKIGGGLAAIGIIAGAAYVVIFSDFFTVSNIALEKRGESIPSSSLSSFIARLKNRNILFLRTDALLHDIEKTFANEILLVEIKKNYPNTVTLAIDEYPAEFNLKIIDGEGIRFLVINQHGFSISDQPQDLLPTVLLRNPKDTDRYKLKARIFEEDFLTQILTAFKKSYEFFDLGIEFAEWMTGPRELHLKTERGFFIWLDITQPIEPQLAKLKRALPKLDIYNESLEYIDLRISSGENEKVIFKRRG